MKFTIVFYSYFTPDFSEDLEISHTASTEEEAKYTKNERDTFVTGSYDMEEDLEVSESITVEPQLSDDVLSGKTKRTLPPGGITMTSPPPVVPGTPNSPQPKEGKDKYMNGKSGMSFLKWTKLAILASKA